MYGDIINNVSFDIGYGAGCNYNNGKYSYSSGGGSDEYMNNVKIIEKAYKENDYIYIEDKYVAIEEKGGSSAIYATSNSKVEIEKLGSKKLSAEEVKNNYDSKMTKYKHTFKKAENGSYYWYSTEPLEK